MLLSCTGWRWGGIWRAKLSRFWTICLVRCASCRIDTEIAARAFRQIGIFHQQVGEAEDGSEGIIDLVGHAGDKLPNGRHFLGVHELGAEDGGVGHIGHDHHDVADVSVFAADRAEIDGKLAADAVAADDR